MLLRIVVEFVNKDRNKLLNPGLAQRLKRQESSQRARLLTNRTTSKREPPGRSDKGGFCEQRRPHRSTRTSSRSAVFRPCERRLLAVFL